MLKPRRPMAERNHDLTAPTRDQLRALPKDTLRLTSPLRQMRETIEDIEDARTIERVKKAHGHRPRVPWSRVKKELGLD